MSPDGKLASSSLWWVIDLCASDGVGFEYDFNFCPADPGDVTCRSDSCAPLGGQLPDTTSTRLSYLAYASHSCPPHRSLSAVPRMHTTAMSLLATSSTLSPQIISARHSGGPGGRHVAGSQPMQRRLVTRPMITAPPSSPSASAIRSPGLLQPRPPPLPPPIIQLSSAVVTSSNSEHCRRAIFVGSIVHVTPGDTVHVPTAHASEHSTVLTAHSLWTLMRSGPFAGSATLRSVVAPLSRRFQFQAPSR